MASLTEIRNRLQPAFTPDQAELIASLHVEMHDQLVKPHDVADLRGAVGQLAEAQQQTEQQVKELAVAQQRTEQQVEQLTIAQHRTEQQVEQLTIAQHRTEQRVEQLTIAQHRTEQRVEQLTIAQQRTEQRLGELAEAQLRTEHVVADLITTVNKIEYSIKDLAKQVGGLAATAGGNLEAYASERIPEVLAERFGFVMESCGTESIEADGKAYEFDAVLRGTIAGQPVIVLCEVKTNISESEVRGFLRIADRVRPSLVQQAPDARVQPLFFGYRAAVVTQKLITSSDAWLAFPRGLVAAA